MGLIEIAELVKGVMQFPALCLSLVRVLKKTPQEKHEEILKRINDERTQFEETGRPKWD